MKDFLSLEDFAKTYKPNLLTEYSKKNKYPMKYYDFTNKSIVKWKCSKCGFEYEDKISDRTNLKYPTSCPICSGSMQEDGKIRKDIAFRCKDLIDREWSVYNELDPEKESISSDKYAEWYCPLCHMPHEVKIQDKLKGYGKVCPDCKKTVFKGTSFKEQAIYYYVKKIYPDAEWHAHFSEEYPKVFADILIPSEKIIIEYENRFRIKSKEYVEVRDTYHDTSTRKNKRRRQVIHKKFDEICKENGYKLYRICEANSLKYPQDYAIEFRCPSRNEFSFQLCLAALLKTLSDKFDINKFNFYKDEIKILHFAKNNLKERSKKSPEELEENETEFDEDGMTDFIGDQLFEL